MSLCQKIKIDWSKIKRHLKNDISDATKLMTRASSSDFFLKDTDSLQSRPKPRSNQENRYKNNGEV